MKVNYKELLNSKGLKNTPCRVMILQAISDFSKPINAEDLYSKLKLKVDEATVYRTLTSFENVGIIRRVNLRRGSTYFELNNDHHHHMVCVNCGMVEDFKENIEIEKILGRIVEKSSNFKIINEHSLELFGLCSKCC